MNAGRNGNVYYVRFQQPKREDFGILGLIVRFVINVAALWLAQALVTGFDIDSAPALIFGALIFGIVNAVIKPIVSIVSCPLTCLTLGFFLLIVNAFMLVVTEWVGGWFDLEFVVDGFWAAFLGALIIAVTSAILSTWADAALLRRSRPHDDDW